MGVEPGYGFRQQPELLALKALRQQLWLGFSELCCSWPYLWVVTKRTEKELHPSRKGEDPVYGKHSHLWSTHPITGWEPRMAPGCKADTASSVADLTAFKWPSESL
jgi:hypothetical protein